MSMRFFINENHDPAFNLALEEILCTNFPEPFLMLWRNGPAVIIGKNQNTLRRLADHGKARIYHLTHF